MTENNERYNDRKSAPARDSEPDPQLPCADRGQRRVDDGRAEGTPRDHRSERGREDDALQRDQWAPSADPRHHRLPGTTARRLAAARRRPPGHLTIVPAQQRVHWSQRAREPETGRGGW